MGIPVNNHSEFEGLVDKLRNETPLFGFVLHDSRKGHKPVAHFLTQSAAWLDELAVQSGVCTALVLRNTSSDCNDNSRP